VTDSGKDPVEQAWHRVEERWDEPEAHQAFIAFCATVDRLDEAGRYYGDVRDNVPSRRAQAEDQIDRLLAHAMSALKVAGTDLNRLENARRWVALVGMVTATLLLAAALIAMLQSG